MKSTIFLTAALVAAADALPGSVASLRQRAVELVLPRQGSGYAPQGPIMPPRPNVTTIQGCFSSSGTMERMGTPDFNDINKCGDEICKAKGYLVGATMGGAECWCGETYPPKEDLVDNKNCNIACAGYDKLACGGLEFWTVYNTGIELIVKHEGDAKKSTTTAGSEATPTSTKPSEKTLVVTQTPTDAPSEDNGGGTNVGGIVAGVVVGVVVIAAAIGGGYLYMRRKRNQEIEEEHRRNAAVSAFIGKSPGSSAASMTDSRLDPVLAHRRMSDGSIADNQDYSRKILRVTNA